MIDKKKMFQLLLHNSHLTGFTIKPENLIKSTVTALNE